jgi:hypothetical protein
MTVNIISGLPDHVLGFVTDQAGNRRAIKAFGILIPGDVKVFDLAHLTDAETWIAE